jgi:reactive chlorine resistance protein C
MNATADKAELITLPVNAQNVFMKVATYVSYYGLVLTIAWIGLLKFTPTEAEAISAFVSNSPLMSWTYEAMSHQTFSNVLGSVELVVAALIAMRPINAKLSALGGLLATGMFLGTLSFMLTTPGTFTGVIFGIVPTLSVPGHFLLKDTVLLGVALQVLAESLASIKRAVT